MAQITSKELIISLIEYDLTNSKLINSLNDIGVDASEYSLNICVSVFRLMGREESIENDPLMEQYFDHTVRSKFLKGPKQFNELALEIYEYLCAVCPGPIKLSN